MLEILVVLAISGMIFSLIFIAINRLIPQKKAVNKAYTTIADLNKVQQDQITAILKQKDKELASKNARIAKMERDMGTDDESEEQSITYEQVVPVLQQQGVDPMLIAGMSMFKDDVNKFLKGKSPEEIGQLAQTLGGVLKNRQSQSPNGTVTPTGESKSEFILG